MAKPGRESVETIVSRGRFISVAVSAILSLCGIGLAFFSQNSPMRILAVVLAVAFAGLAIRSGRVRMELNEEGVLIRREISSETIPWQQVSDFRSSSNGSWVLCVDTAGKPHKALYWSQLNEKSIDVPVDSAKRRRPA